MSFGRGDEPHLLAVFASMAAAVYRPRPVHRLQSVWARARVRDASNPMTAEAATLWTTSDAAPAPRTDETAVLAGGLKAWLSNRGAYVYGHVAGSLDDVTVLAVLPPLIVKIEDARAWCERTAERLVAAGWGAAR